MFLFHIDIEIQKLNKRPSDYDFLTWEKLSFFQDYVWLIKISQWFGS